MGKCYVKHPRKRFLMEKCLMCGRDVLEGKNCSCFDKRLKECGSR